MKSLDDAQLQYCCIQLYLSPPIRASGRTLARCSADAEQCRVRSQCPRTSARNPRMRPRFFVERWGCLATERGARQTTGQAIRMFRDGL
ncbi:hypothetical protein B0H12DRAFT_1122590 [Mycena haematopus]|nr:hypothetical protein B0H12DRAFT_1122590 [Mycena haematopus]